MDTPAPVVAEQHEVPAERAGTARSAFGRRALVASIFVATSLSFTGPALLGGKTLAPTDILLAGAPYREASADPPAVSNVLQNDQVEQLALVAEFWGSLRKGRLQLWEPDQAAGLPLFTAVHNRLFAPWNVAFLFTPPYLAPTVAIALGLLVAQLGMYGLARRIGLGLPGAVFAAVAYAFSGPVIASLLRIHEMLLFPVLLYAVHGAMTASVHRGRYCALTGATLGLTLLAGFPSAAMFSLYFTVAWIPYLAIAGAAPGPLPIRLRAAARRAAPAAVAAGAGVAISLVQLLPSYEFLRSTGSLERTFGIWDRAGIPALASAISGRFFGAYQNGDWWPQSAVVENPFEASLTIGLVALGLLVAVAAGKAGARRGSDPDRYLSRFFLPAGLVVLAGAFLGGPVLGILHQLPFLRNNSFGRARFILVLAVALAAGSALDGILRRRSGSGEATAWAPPSRAQRTQAALIAGMVALGVYEGSTLAAQAHRLGAVAVDLIVPLLAVALAGAAIMRARARPLAVFLLVVAAAAAELQWGSWGFTPASPAAAFYPEPPLPASVRRDVQAGGGYRFLPHNFAAFRPHSAAYRDLADARTAFPAFDRYIDLIQTAEPESYHSTFKSKFTRNLDPASPILDDLSVRYYVPPVGAPPLQTGEGVSTSVEAGRSLPLTMDAAVPAGGIRAISIPLALERGCSRGWIELEAAGVVSRRLAREAMRQTAFPFPDLHPGPGPLRLSLRTTHCPAILGRSPVRVLPPAPHSTMRLVDVNGWSIYERRSAFPRASLAPATIRIDARAKRLDFLRRRRGPGPVVVEEGAGEERLGKGTARLAEDDPDRVVVDVVSDAEGMVVLRDVAAPGWRAVVNGRPETILAVDHAFRGVRVPKGASRVVFRYAPASLAAGAGAAVLGLLVLVGLTAALAWQDRRRRSGERRSPEGIR